MMPRYALVKIAELDDIELAEALGEYDAAFSLSSTVQEIAELIRALLEE